MECFRVLRVQCCTGIKAGYRMLWFVCCPLSLARPVFDCAQAREPVEGSLVLCLWGQSKVFSVQFSVFCAKEIVRRIGDRLTIYGSGRNRLTLCGIGS